MLPELSRGRGVAGLEGADQCVTDPSDVMGGWSPVFREVKRLPGVCVA